MQLPKTLWWILAGAILVRVALFGVLIAQHNPGVFYLGDSYGYTQTADNILAGHGFSIATTSPYLPDSEHTPVVPLALAATKALFGSYTPYILLQIALAAFLVVLTYKLCFLVCESRRVALGAAALMAFEPYAIFINMSLLTETLFAVFLGAGMYATARYIKSGSRTQLAAASALFGLSALTRPFGEYILFVLVFVVLWKEMPRKYAVPLCAAIIPFLIVVSPWIVRNYEDFGVIGFSSGGLQNIYSDLGATVISYRDQVPTDVVKQNLNAQYAQEHNLNVSALHQDLSQSGGLFRAGLSIVIHNPISSAITFLSVVISFFTNDAWTYYLQYWGFLPSYVLFSPTYSLLTAGPLVTISKIITIAGPTLVVPIIGRIFWLAISILFFIGAWVLIRHGGTKRTVAIFALLSVGYFVLACFTNAEGTNGRYRYPLDPLFFTSAAVALSAIRARIKRRFAR
jgi:4-amino-4-deoxy-L-arabinose transferase-like glycosyltransferase